MDTTDYGLKDRARGAMIGVAVGDCVGLPYETWNTERIIADLARQGGRLAPRTYLDPFELHHGRCVDRQAGHCSDDTELTYALGQSLLACRGVDQDSLYEHFRALVHGSTLSPLTGEPGYGWGSLTRKVLEPARYADSLARTDLPLRASNGSLMRTAPIALFFSEYERSDLIAAARAASYVTHRHPLGGDCCALYVLMLDNMLSGYTSTKAALEDAWDSLCSEGGGANPWLIPLVEVAGTELRDNPGLMSGSALRSLSVALWALETAPDFETGITEVVKQGGDTDTNAAIAGGLLGARFGYSGIPVDWREGVVGHDLLCDLADDLIREGAK